VYGLAYGAQSETLYIHLSEGYPLQFGGIVVGFYYSLACYVAQEEEVECVYVHSRVMVYIGDRELIFNGFGVDDESGFFLDFPHHALFGILVVIHKTARQVEGAFGGLLTTPGNQQFAFVVQDKSGC
jgi:hypothetical protein